MRSRAKLARASAWLLALSTLLTAGLLTAQCVQIHEAGAFSREIVRARLEGLAWAGALWLALLAGTLLLRLPNGKESQLRAPITTSRSTGEDQSPVLAENREQRTAAQSSTEAAVEENPSQLLAENRGQMSTARSATEVVSEENRLHIRDGKRGRRMAARFSTEAVPEEVRLRLRLMRAEKTDAMRAEERRRRMARGACAGICAGCAAMVARYLVNPANFTSRELEPVIGRMLWHIAPWIFVGFACAILCECVRGRSFRREIDLAARSVKRASVENARTDSGVPRERKTYSGEEASIENARTGSGEPCERKARPAKTAARAVAFALAVGLLALGAANGGMRDVLVKAINICTECIGLG